MTAPTEPAAIPQPVEPRQHDWDETPAQAARADRDYWDAVYDRDEDE